MFNAIKLCYVLLLSINYCAIILLSFETCHPTGKIVPSENSRPVFTYCRTSDICLFSICSPIAAIFVSILNFVRRSEISLL